MANKPFFLEEDKTYLAASKFDNGLYKIGRSKNPIARAYQLKAELVHVIDADIEKYLHEQYHHKRVEGEYFLLSEQDVADIKDININDEHVLIRLDHKSQVIVREKQEQIFNILGTKPTKQEAILILIKQ